MTIANIRYAAAVAALGLHAVTSGLAAQTTESDPHHPQRLAQTETEGTQQEQGPQDGQSGMMMPGMMMQRGMMGGMRMGGMRMGAMHGHMMNVVFAIIDTDGDGALSFEEITTVHKRIFDAADANKDGKLTKEELRTFVRE